MGDPLRAGTGRTRGHQPQTHESPNFASRAGWELANMGDPSRVGTAAIYESPVFASRGRGQLGKMGDPLL